MTSQTVVPVPAVVNPELACVEKGEWISIPMAPPDGRLRLRLRDVDREEARAVKKRGTMAFHMVGCTGYFQNQQPGKDVAAAMTRQCEEPLCFGGLRKAVMPSFFYHLGDIAYKGEDKDNPEHNDQSLIYRQQFYEPYAGYTPPIFAIAGNHDTKTSKNLNHSAIHFFLDAFCAGQERKPADNSMSGRAAMVQPYPYWLLTTPLAYFVGLHANDVNGGLLDNPLGEDNPQYHWLVSTLKKIRKKADRRAVLLAIHYPPYSGATNFAQRGDPTLSPTAGADHLQPIANTLQRAFTEGDLVPDAIFSAHAHHYQRLTYHQAGGREIPCLIVGSGGHPPIESLAHACDGTLGAPPPPPCQAVLPRGLVLPPDDQVELVAYNDRDFGFLRVTLNDRKRTLKGEFFTVPSPGAPADSFTLDLESHRIKD
jgi:hypothetical protein